MKKYFIEPGDWEAATGECLPSGSEGIEVTQVFSSELATDDWIRERWGGFAYLDIARNENFSFYFRDGNLFLECEREIDCMVSTILLFQNATKQNVIDAERLFGIEIEGK